MAKAGTKSTQQKANSDHRGDNAATEPRDENGRFAKAKGLKLPSVKLPSVKLPKAPKVKVPELTTRNAAIGALGAGVAVAVVAAGAALLRGRTENGAGSDAATGDDDGATASNGATKAVTAADVIDDDKRDAFAPATKPAPSRVEAMGNGAD